MPETGARLFPVVNNSLYFGTNPKHEDVEFARNDEHQVPGADTPYEKVLQGSQNLWGLVEAVKHLANDFTGTKSLELHFSREINILGDWGSEQDSPIYWAFHVASRIAIASKTPNSNVRKMCIQSIASFLHRSKESLYGNTVLLAGMRGAGHPERSSYELDYIISQLFGVPGERLPIKNSWNKKLPKHDEGLNNYGWLLPQSSASWRVLEEAATLAASQAFVPNKIRVPKRILEGPGYKFVWVERDINSNTPFIGLNGYIAHKERFTLPSNYDVHVRQKKSNGEVNVNYSWDQNGNLTRVGWTYTGLYQELERGADNIVSADIHHAPTKYMIYGPDGVTNALGWLLKPQYVPPIQPTTPPPVSGSGGNVRHKSFIRRVIDWIRKILS